jgi:hypothetical protein
VLAVTSRAWLMIHPALVGLQRKDLAMCTRSRTQSRRNFIRAIVAGTAFGLMVSTPTGSLAQTVAPPASAAPTTVLKATSVKLVGLWTVSAWERANNGSYCSAHRLMPGVVGGGVTLQFVLIRSAGGYRIALASERWQMTPKTVHPIELIASSVPRRDVKAIVVAPKVAMIELGADGQFIHKLASMPAIEIKTAQADLKLSLEGFGAALAEVDACFGAFKRPEPDRSGAPETDLVKRSATYLATVRAQQRAGEETLRLLLDKLLVAVGGTIDPFAAPATPTKTADAAGT